MPIEPPLSKLTPEQIFQAFLNNGMDEMHFYNTVKYAGRPATGSQWLAMYDCEFCPDDGVMGRRVPREQAESIETARVFVTVDAHGLLIADKLIMTTMTAEQVLRELVACEDLRVAIVRANSVGRMNDRQFARFERMRAEHARRSLQAWLAARDIVNHKEQA